MVLCGFSNDVGTFRHSIMQAAAATGATTFENSLAIGATHNMSGAVTNSVSIGTAASLNGTINQVFQQGTSNLVGSSTHSNVHISGDSNYVGTTVRLRFTGGITGTFSTSQTVTGGTSTATGVIIGTPGSTSMMVRMLTGTFVSGETITTGTGSAVLTSAPDLSSVGDQAFAHGRGNFVAGTNNFAAGRGNQMFPTSTGGGTVANSAIFGYNNSVGAEKSLVVGQDNFAYENAFALGRDNMASDYNTIAFGRGSQALSLNNFAFGSLCRAGYGDYPNNVAFGGYYAYADGYNSQAFGYQARINSGAAYSTILGGFASTIEATNCLTHGKTAGADIIGQRAFSAQTSSGGSSAGSFPFGPANSQWSFVAHELVFASGEATETITIPLDDERAYSFQVNIIANELTAGTPANRGSFVNTQFLVYQNGGTAALVGTPALTAVTDGTDIANFTTAIGVSGSDLTITFTRNAATLNYFIAYWVSFIETDS